MNTQTGANAPESKAPVQLVPFPTVERPVPKEPSAAPKSSGSMRWTIIAAVVLMVLVVSGIVWWSLGSGATVRYATAPATIGPVARGVSATGTVNPELTIIVGTYVSGVIQELFCDYNTRVKKGQVCAKIDPRPYQSLVDQNRANLAVAKAQLEKDKASLTYTKLALDRAATLVQTHAVSQDSYDLAKSTYDQAQAQITFDQATIQLRQASLDAAQINLDYADIVSPVLSLIHI